MKPRHVSNRFKEYEINYQKKFLIRRAEIRAELEAALKMATIDVGYELFIKLTKAIAALTDIPETKYDLQRYWESCKKI